METLDELWTAFTSFLYEQRIPLLLASVVGVAIGIVIAWRRGWFAAAGRHPARTMVLAGVALGIGLPVAWYLASPIWIRTELVEPVPVAVEAPDPTSDPSRSAPRTTPDPAPAESPTRLPIESPAGQVRSPIATKPPTPTPTPFEPSAVVSGRFHGSDDFHFGRGTASIIEIEPGRYHLRLEGFSVRNGPDLYVYLSPSAKGYAKGALELGKLKATDGSFGYDLPPGADPHDFASAIIWCKQFAHLFATAPLGT